MRDLLAPVEKKKERKNVRIDKLAEGQIIPLKRDFMFTQIFNDENYNFALYQLLSDVLNLNKESFNNNRLVAKLNL